jgi:hypothetical protein
MTKRFQRNGHSSNTQQIQRGNKPINLGFKKIVDSPREPLKCWECGEPHLRRNCPHLNPTSSTTIQSLQEATIVRDMGKYIHKINATLEQRQADHQSTVV